MCDKSGCAHAAMMDHGGKGGGCCKGEGHGHGTAGHGNDPAHTIIEGLKGSNFQGDTTIAIDGGTVYVRRTGAELEVKVERKETLHMEKTEQAH